MVDELGAFDETFEVDLRVGLSPLKGELVAEVEGARQLLPSFVHHMSLYQLVIIPLPDIENIRWDFLLTFFLLLVLVREHRTIVSPSVLTIIPPRMVRTEALARPLKPSLQAFEMEFNVVVVFRLKFVCVEDLNATVVPSASD